MNSGSGSDSSAQTLQRGIVGSMVSVRKIESRDVHTSVDQIAQTLYRPASRPQGADDLSLPAR